MILTKEQLSIKKYSNPLYTVYSGMKKRCYTPSTTGYEKYGGKGIKVCEEWKNDFSVFYEWAINSGYYYNTEETRGQRLSIDRIDSKGDYTPSNCRWITLSENSRRAGLGAIFSEERRKKISLAHKGIPLTEEHKKKLSICGKGKNKGNQYSRKGFYRMYTKEGVLVKTFETQRQITEYFLPRKVALGTINATAHNVGNRKTAYGYKWEYIYDCK